MKTTRRPGNREPGPLTMLFASLLLAAPPAAASADGWCSRTARLQYTACKHELRADAARQKGRCLNQPDDDGRALCLDELREGRIEERSLCREQLRARLEVCSRVGEERYDPDFEPQDFADDFSSPPAANSYVPLVVGNRWDFAAPADDETNTVEVLPRTKLVEGVTCVVSRDLVRVGGVAKEFTDDWLAQKTGGDVVYCGEEVKDYELFPGDVPADPELVSIAGSFKVGRADDLPGIFFLGEPAAGVTYRQEYSLDNAEDVATVLSTSYRFGSDPDLDHFVPQSLADHLCSGDCVVTEESTPIEPGVVARKYYAPNVGVFLEVSLDTGRVNRLVGCNVDPRCATLPQP